MAAFLVSVFVVPTFADDPATFEAQGRNFPVANEAVQGLTPLSEETLVDDWAFLFDQETCFGFTPQVKYDPPVKGQAETFVVSSWCELGGWEGPGRSGLSRYTTDGALVKFVSVQDEGQDPMGHGLGWELNVLDNGNVAAGGPSTGVIPDLEFLPNRVAAIRFFNSDLEPITPLMSILEPELVSGNDERDIETFLRTRMRTLANGNMVVGIEVVSAAAQVAAGLVDPNPDLNDEDGDGLADSPPVGKTYIRIYQPDGTPAGPSRLAVTPEGDDATKWAHNQGHVDLAARPGGGFMIVGQGFPNIGEDSHPVYFFDNDGNLEGGVSVVDPTLHGAFQGGFPPAEISQANGVVAMTSTFLFDTPNLSNPTPTKENPDARQRIQQFAITMFREVAPADGVGAGAPTVEIIRSTTNAFRQGNLSPIRESDLDQDPMGNACVITRGQYFDQEKGQPVGPDDLDDMETVVCFRNDGAIWDGGAAWVPYDEAGYPGSQRDPSLALSNESMVLTYLSNAPREVKGLNVNAHGGVNVFIVYENPFYTGPFLRSDCNSDGSVDLSDGVAGLGFAFLGNDAPGCLAACDNNDDGAIDVTNATYLFNFLFLGGSPPPPPVGECALGTSVNSRLIGCENPQC